MIQEFLKSLLPCRVLDLDGPVAIIDLSVGGPNSSVELTDSYVAGLAADAGAHFLAGGYNEQRAIYRRSALFGEARDIHIGLDLWAPVGTGVVAPIRGTVHSFAYNTGVGNYGPTVILHHKLKEFTFYSLYGHLSAESLDELEIDEEIPAGTVFAALGNRSENGDYAPHLHFQLIVDLEGYSGDYPGVCSSSDLKHYLVNCPDPNLLLKLDYK